MLRENPVCCLGKVVRPVPNNNRIFLFLWSVRNKKVRTETQHRVLEHCTLARNFPVHELSLLPRDKFGNLCSLAWRTFVHFGSNSLFCVGDCVWDQMPCSHWNELASLHSREFTSIWERFFCLSVVLSKPRWQTGNLAARTKYFGPAIAVHGGGGLVTS